MRWWPLLLFAVLPLQWVLVPLPGTAPEPLHVVAVLVLSGLVFLRFRPRAVKAVVEVTGLFVAAMLGLQAVAAAAAVYHSQPVRPVVNQLLLLVSFLAIATLTRSVWKHPRGRAVLVLRWSALVCVLSLVTGLTYAMSRNGVDPVGVLSQTVVTGDPHILERRMFRDGLAGFGYDSADLQSNIRHEIFGAVLVALCTAAAAARLRPLQHPVGVVVFRASLWVSVALVLVSLSRSVLLALLAWAAIAFLRAARLSRLTNAQLGAAVLAMVGTATLVLSGFWTVLVARFATDTTSYTARDLLLGQALADIGAHLWTGGVDTVGRSSHNLVLDSWLRSGIVGAALALLAALIIVGFWLRLLARIHRQPSWMVPIAVLLTFPVVRLFTSGGGSISPVAWVALAVVAGAVAAEREAANQERPPVIAVDAGPFGSVDREPY